MKATIEAGLPGTGPAPIHLHAGKPTEWSEGCVVRFTSKTGDEWLGNIQRGYGYATKIVEWSYANAFIVIAKGACYFVRPNEPTNWKHLDLLGIDANGIRSCYDSQPEMMRAHPIEFSEIQSENLHYWLSFGCGVVCCDQLLRTVLITGLNRQIIVEWLPPHARDLRGFFMSSKLHAPPFK